MPDNRAYGGGRIHVEYENSRTQISHDDHSEECEFLGQAGETGLDRADAVHGMLRKWDIGGCVKRYPTV